jgi:hypothetical protein
MGSLAEKMALHQHSVLEKNGKTMETNMERVLLSGTSYKRKLLSTKITSDEAKSIIEEFEREHQKVIEIKATNQNIKKAS